MSVSQRGPCCLLLSPSMSRKPTQIYSFGWSQNLRFFFPQSILFLNLGFLTNSDRLPYQSEVFLYFLMAFFFSFLFRFVPVCFLATLKAKGRDFVFDMSVLSGAPKQWMLTALMCLQPSPSTSSLSSTHSASPNVTSSAPSSARGQCQGVGLTEGVPGAVAPAP